MKRKSHWLPKAVLVLLFALLLAVPALSDHDMWVESYYEFAAAEAPPERRIADYFLFEGDCTGIDFYISGDGSRLMLYGAPLIPGEYFYDILLTYDDDSFEYIDFWLFVDTIEVAEPEEPAPTPAPPASGTNAAEDVPSPTTVPDLVITKHPTGETVTEGGSAYFVARADYASLSLWSIEDPDGMVYEAGDAPAYIPSLSVSGLGTDTLHLSGIPRSMDGWYVVCTFIGLDGTGSATTNRAKITVNEAPAAAPAAAPIPTAEPTPEPAPEKAEPAGIVRPTREPAAAKTLEEAPADNKGEKSGGEGTAPAAQDKEAGGINAWLIVAIVLGVAVVGLGTAMVLMQTKKKTAAPGHNASAAPAPYRFRCDKCGWEPEDPGCVPRFCPNCGDVFDEKDVTVAGRAKDGKHPIEKIT